MKRLITLVMLLFVGTAFATDFEWQNPTDYEDGTPIVAGDLVNVTLICEGQTFVYTMGETMSTEDFAPGTYQCVATAETANGLTSAPSNAVSFTVAPPPSPPLPPILTVTE